MRLLLLLLLLGCVPDRPEETIPNPSPKYIPPSDSNRGSTDDIPTQNPDVEKRQAPIDVAKKIDSLSPQPGDSTGPKPLCQAMYVINTSGNGAMMRKGAGIQYEGLLPPVSEGDTVTAVGTEGGWTDIKIDNRLGYIDSRHLSCSKVTPQEPPKQNTAGKSEPLSPSGSSQGEGSKKCD